MPLRHMERHGRHAPSARRGWAKDRAAKMCIKVYYYSNESAGDTGRHRNESGPSR